MFPRKDEGSTAEASVPRFIALPSCYPLGTSEHAHAVTLVHRSPFYDLHLRSSAQCFDLVNAGSRCLAFVPFYSIASTRIGFSSLGHDTLARRQHMGLSQTLLSVQEAARSMELLNTPAETALTKALLVTPNCSVVKRKAVKCSESISFEVEKSG